jgi:hypothetical protein
VRIHDVMPRAATVDAGKLPMAAAQVTLPLRSLSTCMLANHRIDETHLETYTVHFRDLHAGPRLGLVRAGAEVLKLTANREATVTVEIDGRPVGQLCNSAECGDAFLANEVSEYHDQPGLCGDWRVGRHFELYYGLSKQPPTGGRGAVPHASGRVMNLEEKKCGDWPVLPPKWRSIDPRTVVYRPICPPALFDGMAD